MSAALWKHLHQATDRQMQYVSCELDLGVREESAVISLRCRNAVQESSSESRLNSTCNRHRQMRNDLSPSCLSCELA